MALNRLVHLNQFSANKRQYFRKIFNKSHQQLMKFYLQDTFKFIILLTEYETLLIAV